MERGIYQTKSGLQQLFRPNFEQAIPKRTRLGQCLPCNQNRRNGFPFRRVPVKPSTNYLFVAAAAGVGALPRDKPLARALRRT
jgi:hypothetical protein